ncbi:MAG: DUF523 domain-containing protein [Candidatus Brocadiaceae bacterium]|nr:DUF523 domain-containing protein [Candidatus Brocadiaceae bacterium]
MHAALSPRQPVLVSACLLGLCTRFDGRHCRRDDVVAACRRLAAVPVCPEQLGGLATPRPPAEIEHGSGEDVLAGSARVVNDRGECVTSHFLHGAQAVAEVARLLDIRRAILKEGSPSCGVARIKRADRDVRGEGVTAALLRRMGVNVDGVE